jgi:hypothetical protein
VERVVDFYRPGALANPKRAAERAADALRRILPETFVAIRRAARESARENLARQYLFAAHESGIRVAPPAPLDTTSADRKAAEQAANEYADAWLKAAMKAIESEKAERAERA